MEYNFRDFLLASLLKNEAHSIYDLLKKDFGPREESVFPF